MPANHRAWPEGIVASTATTRSTTAATSATAARTSACRRCPTSTPCSALQRRELAPRHRPPLFAEVDLISSHAPWTQIPRLIPWDEVGDGSVFDRVPAEESTQASLFGDAERARAAYGHSIEYSLRTLFSFVQRYGDDKTVLVVLGDHQPATLVTGQGADPRRADLGHRPRPEGDAADRRLGLAGRDAARARRRRSGRWTRSATASSPRSGRRHEAGRPHAVRPGPAPRARRRPTARASSSGRRAS